MGDVFFFFFFFFGGGGGGAKISNIFRVLEIPEMFLEVNGRCWARTYV